MGNKQVKKHLPRMIAVVTLALGTVVALAGSGTVVFAAPVQPAQTSKTNNLNTLKISPVRSDLSIAPGKSGTITMKVTNLTSAPMTVHPIENDFVAGDEKGTPALILDENSFAPTHSLKRYMVPLKDVTVPANAIKDVVLTINVPANAKPGGYYGAVRFAPVTAAGDTSVSLNASAASLVLMTVPGNMIEQLELTNFDIQQGGNTIKDFLRTPDNLSLLVRFENKGSVQVGPFGQVWVKQGDKVIYSYDFNQNTPRDQVLPDSARRWDVPLQKLGNFGQYTIGATFTYGTKNQSIDVSKTIWIVPTAYIYGAIIGVVVLILLIVGIWFFLRSYKRRILSSHSRGRYRR